MLKEIQEELILARKLILSACYIKITNIQTKKKDVVKVALNEAKK